MIQRVIASQCPNTCDEPCVDAWPPWESYGKCMQIDTDDKEMVAGASAVYNACPYCAIKFKTVTHGV